MKRVLISLLTLLLAIPALSKTGEKIFKSKCISCHGTKDIFPKVPSLSGQEPGYIKIQLRAFATNERLDNNMGSMNRIAKALSSADIEAVATYIAGQEPCLVEVSVNQQDPKFLDIYKAGAKLVAANNCMHCHGNFHHAAPRLMGQKKGYLKHTLTEFLNGDRKNKYMDRTLPILDEESINSLSTYFNAQRLMRECNIN